MARRLYINSSFGCDTAMPIIAQLRLMDRQSAEDIFLVVDSYGGSLSSCLAIHDQIRRMRSRVSTLVVGKAMSAGAFVAISGTRGVRMMMANATLMHHDPIGMCELSYEGMESIRRNKEYVYKILSEASNLSEDELAGLLDRNLFLTAQQAKEYGFIDEIIGGDLEQ